MATHARTYASPVDAAGAAPPPALTAHASHARLPATRPLEHAAQMSEPHRRQWCRRLMIVNAPPQRVQALDAQSGK